METLMMAMLCKFSRNLGLLAITAAFSGVSMFPAPVQAQQAPSLLEQRGTLQPLQHEYTFEGKKQQVVAIVMTSDSFDPVLSLLDPSDREIATNDDFARTLNATIVVTLPDDGTYKVIARSLSGQGGDYTVTVKPATAYQQAYARAAEFYGKGNFSEAITAYTEAIQLDPNQPSAYLDRGDVYYAQDNLQALIADYQRAADLYEKAGDRDNAQMVRDQIQYFQDAHQQSSFFSYPEPSVS